MTAELLKKVAEAKKINLTHFDHVIATINDNYTKISISFFNLLVYPGGQRRWCNVTTVTKNVAAILKNVESTNIWPEDYETDGAKWIREIK